MSRPEPFRDIEIDEDVGFHHREQKIQRVAWVIMTLLLAAALLGLFGSGPLSNRVAGQQGGALWVEYQRFARWHAPHELRVHLGPEKAPDGRAVVWLGRPFIEAHDVDHVTPPPEAVEVHGDHYAYVFRVPSAADEVAITFTLRSEGWGRSAGTVGVRGGPSVTFQQFVYP